jgi:Fe-S-cluster containining protein
MEERLLASISASMETARRLGGEWIACRPGCTSCCMGPFAITSLDALRLQKGLEALRRQDPARAAEIQRRAESYLERMGNAYPGDLQTGILDDEDALPAFLDEVPCPALDPKAGTCDLYEARPVTCRTFGPVTRVGEESFGACELCYQGASDAEMAACAVEIDPEGLEPAILDLLETEGSAGMTIVAFAVRPGASWP